VKTVMHLQYTGKREKQYIKEAFALEEPFYGAHVGNGWRYLGQGAYKTVYKKGNVVVKFAVDHEIWSEVSCYFTAHPYWRRNFARIYGFSRDRIVQKYIPKFKSTKQQRKEAAEYLLRVEAAMNIDDVYYGHNVRIHGNRAIIFDLGINIIPAKRRKHIPKYLHKVIYK